MDWLARERVARPRRKVLDVRFDSAFWTLLPVFMIVTLVGAVKTIGDTIGIQQVSWRRPRATDFRAVQRAVAADGVGNFLSGLAGTAPNTTYSPSVAVVELTGVAARSVGVCIGVLFVMIAFLPKATAALLAVPEPVIAAYATVLTAMLFVGGMRMVVQDGVDYRESLVVGLAFWLGVGFQNQAIFADYLGGAVGSIFGNGMTAGGLTAILMTLVMGLVARRRKMAAKLHVESLSKIDEFLRRFARDKRWHQAATERLCAVAEEAILSLVPDEDASTVEEARHLLLVVRGDSRAAELEFIASEVEQNIEDRLALLGPWAEGNGRARIFPAAAAPLRESGAPPAVLRRGYFDGAGRRGWGRARVKRGFRFLKRLGPLLDVAPTREGPRPSSGKPTLSKAGRSPAESKMSCKNAS